MRVPASLERPSRSEPLRCAVVLAALLNVFFFPYLWGGKSLLSASRDIPSIYANGAAGDAPNATTWKLLDPYGSGAVGEPNFALEHRQLFVEHRLPLWNPDVAFGAPQAAAMQEQPFYPLAWPMQIAPSPRTYAWYVASRFFVAGFFAFLFLRFFVARVPAFAGAVAFMLTGYFVMFSSMTHLSVEVLLGAALYATESLVRSRGPATMVGMAAVVVLSVAGGMPEATLLALCFAYAYFVVRVASNAELRRRAWPLAARYAAANVLGFAASAFVLLPFVEYVVHSVNGHAQLPRGLLDVDSYPGLLLPQYLAPLLYGPPWQEPPPIITGTPGLRGYWGTVPAFLGTLAIAAACVRRRSWGPAAPTWFFAGIAGFLILKRFGFPVVNAIGALPGFRFVIFDKYDEPLIGFAVAALCAFGLAYLLSGEARRAVVFAACLVVLAALSAGYAAGGSVVLAAQSHLTFFYGAVLGALAALTASAALALGALAARTHRARSAVGASMAALIVVELTANYYVPMYFVVNSAPPAATNPYAGAPYIDFLRAHAGRERVIGVQTVLQPDWAEAFDLQDVRDNDALYVDAYFPFVRRFLPPDHGAMAVVVNGGYSLADASARRLLQLGSVRYVLEPDRSSDPALASHADFRLAYARDAAIFRFANALPRAALYTNVRTEADAGAVLDAISAPDAAVERTAFVDASSVPADRRERIAALASGPAHAAAAAAIVGYDSERVDVRASTPTTAMLVLSDTRYPGWNAYVDGAPEPIVGANYLFRGVLVPAGTHAITFRYEPASYRLGWLISAAALVIAIALVIVPRMRARIPRVPEASVGIRA